MAGIEHNIGAPVPGGKRLKGVKDVNFSLLSAGSANVGQRRGLMGKSTPDVFNRTPSQQAKSYNRNQGSPKPLPGGWPK